MTDEQRKMLTKYLGECWHETEGTIFVNSPKSHLRMAYNRTFTTAQDMVDLKNRMVEKGDWEEFLRFCFNSSDGSEPMSSFSDEGVCGENRFYDEDFFAWLLNPARFCQLVAEWRESS